VPCPDCAGTHIQVEPSLGRAWTSTDETTPLALSGGTADVFHSMSCAQRYCVGLSREGTVHSWGLGSAVALGRASSSAQVARVTALPLTMTVTAVMAIDYGDLSNASTLALDSYGTLWEFGTHVETQPTPVQLGSAVIKMCTKGAYVMVQLHDYTIYSWGADTAQFYIGRGGFTREVRSAR
jgi:alpha-tubulin suppressor-like RCC1 family protein